MHSNIWNLCSSKERLGIMEKTQAHKRHLINIITAKSKVNTHNQEPIHHRSFSPLSPIQKKTIQQNNLNLARKLMSISRTQHVTKTQVSVSRNLKTYSSLNRIIKQKEIEEENNKIFSRLITTPSTLKRSNWARSSRQAENYKENLNRSRCNYLCIQTPNLTTLSRRARLSRIRPNSNACSLPAQSGTTLIRCSRSRDVCEIVTISPLIIQLRIYMIENNHLVGNLKLLAKLFRSPSNEAFQDQLRRFLGLTSSEGWYYSSNSFSRTGAPSIFLNLVLSSTSFYYSCIFLYLSILRLIYLLSTIEFSTQRFQYSIKPIQRQSSVQSFKTSLSLPLRQLKDSCCASWARNNSLLLSWYSTISWLSSSLSLAFQIARDLLLISSYLILRIFSPRSSILYSRNWRLSYSIQRSSWQICSDYSNFFWMSLSLKVSCFLSRALMALISSNPCYFYCFQEVCKAGEGFQFFWLTYSQSQRDYYYSMNVLL